MGVNNMSEFTLFTALNSIKKHLLVTVVLFIASYWLLPSSNILDNRYSMEKTIIIGEYVPGYQFDFLNYSQMHAILTNANTRLFLGNNIDGGVAQFQISKTKEKNIMLVLKNHNRDNIIHTARLIMKRLQEFDELQIQKQIILINKEIADQHKLLQIISLPDEEYIPSNADIEKFATMQKIYDSAYATGSIGETSIELDKIVSLKIEEVNNKISLEQTLFKLNSKIEQLNEIKKNGFKPVSFLFPVSPQDVTKYYPNQMIFFSISLFVAFLYNLIMLNVLYIKNKKKV
jgi:hypothetical protein